MRSEVTIYLNDTLEEIEKSISNLEDCIEDIDNTDIEITIYGPYSGEDQRGCIDDKALKKEVLGFFLNKKKARREELISDIKEFTEYILNKEKKNGKSD